LGDTSANEAGVALWKKVLGFDPKDPEQNRTVSPAFQADRFKVPVFLAVGTDDIRTPMEQTMAMQRALKEAGKPVTLLVKPDEGHGFGKLENLVELYARILEFLRQNIGTR
jgi:dipeptidyl aminopeptidase/acylaminoacyl peptidase